MAILQAAADELQEESAVVAPAPRTDSTPSVPPSDAYPRRIYKVDDIGMIIGGASEDAKAKVGRLRIQD